LLNLKAGLKAEKRLPNTSIKIFLDVSLTPVVTVYGKKKKREKGVVDGFRHREALVAWYGFEEFGGWDLNSF